MDEYVRIIYHHTTDTAGNEIYISDTNGGLYTSGNEIYISGDDFHTSDTSNYHINYPSSTITIGNVSIKSGYTILKLSRDDVPIHVFVYGRMVTLGILGTNVECAYIGDQLVFSPNVIVIDNSGYTTISVEYKDETRHYYIGGWKDNTLVLDADLVSIVKK